MTIFGCDVMAEDLAAYKNSTTEIDLGSGYSDVFSRNEYTGILSCQKGFDERYQMPAHKGGKYVTRTDLNALMNIGIMHGQAKIHGWKPRWDSDFCSCIGGYPKGSILRSDDGIRMISREGHNTQPVPEDGKSNDYWQRCTATPKFRSNISYDLNPYGRGNFNTIDLDVMLPRTPTTSRQLVATFDGTGGLVIFAYKLITITKSHKTGIYELCQEGNMTVKLSKYPDIYTEPTHADAYVEVLHTARYTVPRSKYETITYAVKSPHKVVPLKKGTRYYLYIEYENGHAEYNSRDGGPILEPPYAKLMVWEIGRGLEWPTIA